MRIPLATMAVILALGAPADPAFLQSRGGGSGVHGGEDETGPYDLVANWPRPFAQAGFIWGSQTGVFAEASDRVFLTSRGELKLPGTLPADFLGAWGVLGRATDPPHDVRNCIAIVDGD